MIVCSVGLQKSGSALFFNLTNDLLIAVGGTDIRFLREEFNLHDIFHYFNCNIEELTMSNLQRLIALHEKRYHFAVKTHCGPSEAIKKHLARGVLQITCICCDPRDVVISALDHGEKIRAIGLNHTFASCRTLSDTILQVKSWITTFMDWLELIPLHLCRFEDLMSAPLVEMRRLQCFLGLDREIDLRVIWERYRGQMLSEDLQEHLHFNVGVAGLFRSVLTGREIEECNHHFGAFLERLGYEI